MIERRRKLVYCHFGDDPAIAVVMALHGFKTRNLEAMLQGNNRATCGWLWEGFLLVKNNSEQIPMATAMIRPQADNESALGDGLGYLPQDRLFVYSKTRPGTPKKLLDFDFTGKATARLINGRRLDYARLAAIQIVDTFLVHPPVAKTGAHRNRGAGSIVSARVDPPYFARL